MTMRLSFLLTGLFVCNLIAGPVFNNFKPFPPNKVIYHATDATLAEISPINKDEKTGENQFVLKFIGEWQIDPDLQGADLAPQAGVFIGADTDKRKQQLVQLHKLLSSLKGKKIGIEIFGGSVNKNRVTYTWPELIKIK